jgi:CheY-like chemotaxis protein
LSISNQGGSTRREKYLILREDIFKEIDNYEYEFDINLGALVIDRFQLNFEMFTSGFNYLVVVDDQRLVRRNTVNLIKIVISSMRINNLLIIEAVDGLDLLNIVRRDKEKSIKCIFTDENMDYINGSEAVKIIRNMEDKNKVNHYHIISITAFDDTETKNQIIKSGINSVIIKPCSKTYIINIFKSLGIGNT